MVGFIDRGTCEGSITIEAALMLPLMMMVCLGLMTMGIYYHDLLVGDARARYVADSLVLGEAAEDDFARLLIMKPEGRVKDSSGLLWQKRMVTFDSGSGTGFPGKLMGVRWSEEAGWLPAKSFLRLVDFAEDGAAVFGLPSFISDIISF